jgi:hypothetical protein
MRKPKAKAKNGNKRCRSIALRYKQRLRKLSEEKQTLVDEEDKLRQGGKGSIDRHFNRKRVR